MEIALKTLRTNIVFGFLMLNFLWVVILFQLQLLSEVLQDVFFIPIPKADNPGNTLLIEPLGFAFLLVFGLILLIQFIGMIRHRWETFCHIIARTEIRASEDTVSGKLKTAEKLLSLESTVDDELGLPPPDYGDEEPEADYDDEPNDDLGKRNSNDSAFDRAESLSSRDRYRYGDPQGRDPMAPLPPVDSVASSFRPAYSHEDFDRNGYEVPYLPNDGRSYYDPVRPRPVQRLTRKYTRRRQPVGQIRVGGQTLSRQFQSRYKRLVSQIDGSKQDGSRQIKRETTFDDVYRTVRDRFVRSDDRSHSQRYPQAYRQQYFNRQV